MPAGLVVRDYFTPYNERTLNTQDADLGSGGPMLLPDQPGEHPHLMLVGAKDAKLYLLDRVQVGPLSGSRKGNAVQVVKFRDGIYAAPAYWNRHVYVLPSSEELRDFSMDRGRLNTDSIRAGTQLVLANAGANPTISANGTRDGIVWVIESKTWNGGDKPAILHAYDVVNVSYEIYNSGAEQRP